MPGDLKISELPALAGNLVEATDPIALADISASETKKVTIKDLIQRSLTFVDDGSIPSSKLAAAWTISDGAVVTAKLADHSVTGRKLADNSSLSVVTGFPAAGEFVGQIVLDLTTSTAQVWGGTGWLTWTTNGGVNKLTPYSDGIVATAPTATGDTVELRAGLTPTTAKAQFLAGPATAGGAIAHRAITGPDLPTASSTAQGAVVVNGNGLRISAGGVLAVDNDVTASSATTYGVVTYNAKGLVTGGRAITALDLPAAAAGTIGAISPGPEFTISATGELRHLNALTAGTGAKFTYDAQGHITGTAALLAADIPDIPAEKLTTGTLDIGRLADRSVTAAKLADYAISFIQEGTPPATNVHHNGQLWLTESTGALRMWNGNSWFPIGSGRLTAENLRYCGVFDATTSKITGITQFGTTAGFKIGDALPAATDAETGVYFVCSVPGNAVSVATGITFDAGDWILCNGNTAGWVRIDTLNGASGGGGGTSVTHLDDLLDVTLTTPAPGNTLQFNAAGQWVNVRSFSTGGTAPATPATGAFWLDTTVATAPVLKVWDGSAWVGAGAGGVTSGATAPSSPSRGDTWVNTTGTGNPVLSIWDGTKWVALAPLSSPTFTGTPAGPTAAAGTDTTQLATTAFVQAAQLLSKTGTTLSAKTSGDLMAPGILPAATTAAQGAVQLATTADVTAGTAGRVVTADQLKATNDAGMADAPDGTADGTAQFVRQVVSVGTVHTKTWVAAPSASVWTRTGTTLGATTAGDLVAPAALPLATTAARGAVQLATSAEAATGTDTAKAVTPRALADGYLAKNISTLTLLP